jgi:hypothetical protein
VPIALSETESVSKIDSIAHAPLTSSTSRILFHRGATRTSKAGSLQTTASCL